MTAYSARALSRDSPLAWGDWEQAAPADAQTAESAEEALFEARLVAEAAAGCDEAFRLLVTRYQSPVFRLCYRVLESTEDAQEACQDTFVRAHRALARYTDKASFSAWLFRIALNVSRDKLRARRALKRRGEARRLLPLARGGAKGGADSLPSEVEKVTCTDPDPVERLALSDDLERLRQQIALLPAKLREVMLLAGLEGLDQESCAEILGCSVRAVEGRLYRARRCLLKAMNAAP